MRKSYDTDAEKRQMQPQSRISQVIQYFYVEIVSVLLGCNTNSTKGIEIPEKYDLTLKY